MTNHIDMRTITNQSIDLGSGIIEAEIRFIGGRAEGIYYEHVCKNGAIGPGWIPLTGPHKWTIEQLDPLTLSPSLLCPICGHHGFIRNGKWVSA